MSNASSPPLASESATALIHPDDEHNRALVRSVHPPDWVNPTPSGTYNLVVIGAGTAGLVSAAGAAGLGARVALVERHLMGGDCLNVGCVPSKALLRASRVAANARGAAAYGVHVGDVRVDFAAIMERMRRLRAGIAPIDGAERFSNLGVDVFMGSGQFTGPRTAVVDGVELRFAKAVIATGARAAVPAIPGLDKVPFLTNDTLFELTDLPGRLTVIGGGPIGCEMAQAFARFGSSVTLVDRADRILRNDDPDAAAVVERALRRDGIELLLGASIAEVRADKTVVAQVGGAEHVVASDAILVAAGRTPNVSGLGLDRAGVELDGKGVRTDERLRTTNKRIFAAGDVASRYQFTHAADAMARLVLRNSLFWGRGKVSSLTIPWATYTDPEIAHVGLTAERAAEQGIAIDTFAIQLDDLDRAILDGETEGFFKVHVARGKDAILGATFVGAHAGESIGEVALAMQAGAGLGTLANTVHPYPTQAEAIKRAADAWSRTRLTPTVAKIFAWLLRRQRS